MTTPQAMTAPHGMKPRVEILDITPDLASKMLDTVAHDTRKGNRVQRRLRKAKVQEFADAMRRGEWTLNFSTLVFSVDPARFGDNEQHLVDGQHRLAAVIESGETVQMVVGWGAAPRVEETVDTGIKRTLSDMLVMRGEKDTNNLAAAVRWVLRYALWNDMRPRTPDSTVQQALIFLDAHPEIRDAVTNAGRSGVEIYGAPRSIIAALYYLFGLVDEDDRDAFFEGASMGVGLEAGDPRLVLREWCIRSMQVGPTRARPRTWLIAALMIKAWNAWREGRKVNLLAFRGGGSSPERFPLIDGLEPEMLASSTQEAQAA